MTDEVGPTKDECAQAVSALLPVLSGLVEVAAEIMVSDRVVRDHDGQASLSGDNVVPDGGLDG